MELSKPAVRYLLELSRQSIEYFLETKNFLPYEKLKIPAGVQEEVKQKSGAFVLLEIIKNEQRKAFVRGENGVFERVEELAKLVTQLAVNAAFFYAHHPRFKSYELNELRIHLILPEAKKRVQGSYSERVGQWEGTTGGVILESRGRFAYDLPNFLGKSESIEHRIRKLRLQLGIKRKAAETDVEYYTFEVQHFKEK